MDAGQVVIGGPDIWAWVGYAAAQWIGGVLEQGERHKLLAQAPWRSTDLGLGRQPVYFVWWYAVSSWGVLELSLSRLVAVV